MPDDGINYVESERRCCKTCSILTVLLIALFGIGCVALTVLLYGDVTDTPGGKHMNNGNESNVDVCSNESLTKYIPFSFRLDNDTSGVFRCGWSATDAGIRGGIAAFFFIFDIISVWAMIDFPESTWVCAFFLLALSLLLGYFTVKDLVVMADSYVWCESGLPGFPFVLEPDKITCVYDWLFANKGAECALILFTLVLVIEACMLHKAVSWIKTQTEKRTINEREPLLGSEGMNSSSPASNGASINVVDFENISRDDPFNFVSSGSS